MRDQNGRFMKGPDKDRMLFEVGHKYRNTGRTRFKPGENRWLGRKHTDEAKKKNRLAHLGLPTPKMAFKKGDPRITGPNNPVWNGGTSSARTKMWQSQEYKDWRQDVFERDNYTCQGEGCGQIGGKLNAHHIRSYSLFPELRLDLSNGQTLCLDCHKKTDNFLVKARYQNTK